MNVSIRIGPKLPRLDTLGDIPKIEELKRSTSVSRQMIMSSPSPTRKFSPSIPCFR